MRPVYRYPYNGGPALPSRQHGQRVISWQDWANRPSTQPLPPIRGMEGAMQRAHHPARELSSYPRPTNPATPNGSSSVGSNYVGGGILGRLMPAGHEYEPDSVYGHAQPMQQHPLLMLLAHLMAQRGGGYQ